MHPISTLETSTQLAALVVDSDRKAQKAIFDVVANRGFSCQVFDAVAPFLHLVASEPTGCIFISSQLPDGSGLDVQLELKSRGWSVPIIVTSDVADVSRCSEAFIHGAVGFLLKPLDPHELEKSLDRATDLCMRIKAERDSRVEALQRLGLLTQREREVLGKIVEGYPIKSIAAMFGTSFQAVARHRQRILDKLRLPNDVALTRWVLESQILDELLREPH